MKYLITSLLLFVAPVLAVADPIPPVASQPAHWNGGCPDSQFLREEIHNLRRENRRLVEVIRHYRKSEATDQRALIVEQCNQYSDVMPCMKRALNGGIRGEVVGSCYRYSDNMKCLEIIQVASEQNQIDISDRQIDACYSTSDELNCLRILGGLPTR